MWWNICHPRSWNSCSPIFLIPLSYTGDRGRLAMLFNLETRIMDPPFEGTVESFSFLCSLWTQISPEGRGAYLGLCESDGSHGSSFQKNVCVYTHTQAFSYSFWGIHNTLKPLCVLTGSLSSFHLYACRHRNLTTSKSRPSFAGQLWE